MYSWYRVIGVDTGLEEHFVMVYWEQRGVNGNRVPVACRFVARPIDRLARRT
jgi:hypothetical protein